MKKIRNVIFLIGGLFIITTVVSFYLVLHNYKRDENLFIIFLIVMIACAVGSFICILTIILMNKRTELE